MFNISVTDTAVANLFEQLAAPVKLEGLDYTQAFFIYDNLQRLYARLYPMMMLDFVHQKDYNTFVLLTKMHTHKVAGHTIALPSKKLMPFKPLTLAILAATASPEPWTGIPAKTLSGGLVLSPMYSALREVSKTSLKIDKAKKSYI